MTGSFAALHADRIAFDTFLKGMTGGSLMSARALASSFPWQTYCSSMNIGTRGGAACRSKSPAPIRTCQAAN